MSQTGKQRPYLPPAQLPGASLKREESRGLPLSRVLLIVAVTALVTTAVILGGMTLLTGGDDGETNPVRLAAAITETPAASAIPDIVPTATPLDSDGDGIPDAIDNCILTINPDQADMDEDRTGDLCDSDSDGDQIENAVDNCPDIANAMQQDADEDGAGDVCDTDDDNDNILDEVDNCPQTVNPLQMDLDGDGTGDACDTEFDLSGMMIDVDGDVPIYSGSLNNSVVLKIDYERGESPASGSEIEVIVSDGTLHDEAMTCDTPGADHMTLSGTTRSVRYCPPGASVDVMVTAREVDSSGMVTDSGTQITLETTLDDLTLLLDQVDYLNRKFEPDETDLSRCYFTDPVGEIVLEEATIPLSMRLETDDTDDTGRQYMVTFQIPPQGLFIAEEIDGVCGLLTSIDPLQNEATFEVEINRTYTLYYLPPEDPGLTTYALRVFMPGMPIAPQTITIQPLLRATSGLNVRGDGGQVADTLAAGDRVRAMGISQINTERWLQVRTDEESELLWINIGQLAGNFEGVGDLEIVSEVDPPSFIADDTDN